MLNIRTSSWPNGIQLFLPMDVLIFMQKADDVATCMFYTGIDPFTKQKVYVAQHLRDRKLQRALMQYSKPENYFEVRKALEQAGRQDLIGSGCNALIPAHPPKEALKARMERANSAFRGEYVHTIPEPDRLAATRSRARPAKNRGYRPGRKTAQRRPRRVC